MNKQQNFVTASLALQNKIDRWDFDKSVVKMRELGRAWSKMTMQVARELYFAKEFLTRQKGQRRDPDAPNFIQYTWNDYCEAVDISRDTADYWLKKFTPRELSETGKDILLLKSPDRTEETTASHALMQARIAEVLRTGIRPADFTDEEEAEYARQLKNAELTRLTEQAAKYNALVTSKAKDYFGETLKHSKDIAKFNLDDRDQLLAQLAIFKHVAAYLDTFENVETRAKAAFNIALKTRNIANEIAELNFQLSESAQAKDEEHGS